MGKSIDPFLVLLYATVAPRVLTSTCPTRVHFMTGRHVRVMNANRCPGSFGPKHSPTYFLSDKTTKRCVITNVRGRRNRSVGQKTLDPVLQSGFRLVVLLCYLERRCPQRVLFIALCWRHCACWARMEKLSLERECGQHQPLNIVYIVEGTRGSVL